VSGSRDATVKAGVLINNPSCVKNENRDRYLHIIAI
jgi:hypothetical protein